MQKHESPRMTRGNVIASMAKLWGYSSYAPKIAGRVAPKEVLESLLPELKLKHRRELLDQLTVDDLRQIREQDQMASIRQFVEQHRPVSMAG